MKYFMFKKRYLATIFGISFLLVALAGAETVLAQDQTSTDLTMQFLRDKVTADKKLLVSGFMELTDAEAKGFWPIYDSYQKDLQSLNERLDKTLQCYADAYNNNKLTDQMALKLSEVELAIDETEIKMRKDYTVRLVVVLPGMKAARYLQIETKIRAQLKYELAAEVPLMK